MSVVKKNTAKVEAPKGDKAKATPAKAAAVAKAAPAKAKPAPAKATVKIDQTPVTAEGPVKSVRKQLAALIQEKVKATGKAVPLAIAEVMVVAYEEAVAELLATGSDVNLPGFGKFIVKDKEAAEKRNPATGEMVTVAAHKAVRFKVGTKLKKTVNGGVEQSEEDEGDE